MDSETHANFDSFGIVVICVALFIDGVSGATQEEVLKRDAGEGNTGSLSPPLLVEASYR